MQTYPAEYVKNYEVIKGTIEWFSPKIGRNLAMIERFNGTLKKRIWKSFTANHNRKLKDDLPKFIDGYNKSIHRTIGIPPANVNKENSSEIWMKVYGGNYAEFPIPKFHVGDVVHLKEFKEVIQGGKSLDVNCTLLERLIVEFQTCILQNPNLETKIFLVGFINKSCHLSTIKTETNNQYTTLKNYC